MFKSLFLVFSILLALFLLIYKLFICRLKRTPKISLYVSGIAGMMLCYILSAIMCVIFEQGILNKILYIFFGLSPFLIGKFATYKNESFFSYIQISVIILGIGLVLIL